MDEVSAIGTKKQWWLDFWNIPADEAESAWKSKLELDAKGSYECSFGVISDIQPYKSMATGEMITSRSKHREHLNSRGLSEVGDQHESMQKHMEQSKQSQAKAESKRLREEIAARLSTVTR